MKDCAATSAVAQMTNEFSRKKSVAERWMTEMSVLIPLVFSLNSFLGV